MVNFFIIDITFLIFFSLGVLLFLYKRRENLKKEGIMYLYRTKLGIELIEKISKKNKKLLKALAPLIIFLGYILMGIMLVLLYQTLLIYVTTPEITDVISAPPVMPLIPYFPQIFGVESLMPPFYFTYFILALLIVAVVHEFSHGIFMKTFNMKIKSTGFAFLGPILGAFVEQDQKDFEKKGIKEQMTVLGAGVFANLFFALIFYLLLILFFSVAYNPVGFNTNLIISNNQSNLEFFEDINQGIGNLSEYPQGDYILYVNIEKYVPQTLATVLSIDGIKIYNLEDVGGAIKDKTVGESIELVAQIKDKKRSYNFTLTKHPTENRSFIGLGNFQGQGNGTKDKILNMFMSFKDPTTKYVPNFDSADFIYNLFWWVMIINLLVALFNMLPLGILDGGRFFYLTLLVISKNKKFAERGYKLSGKLILLMFLLMMLFWLKNLVF